MNAENTGQHASEDRTDHLLEHEYDGIQEYDNPLPRWWLALFWITVIATPGHTPGHCAFLVEPAGVVVLGDMLELGDLEEESHRLVGRRAAEFAAWYGLMPRSICMTGSRLFPAQRKTGLGRLDFCRISLLIPRPR